MKKTLIALFATASVFAGVSAASAQTAPASSSTNNQLTVRATLTNGCAIDFDNGADVVDFGAITDLSKDRQEQRSFHIKCTSDLQDADGNKDSNTYVPSYVTLDAGSVANSTIADRLLGYADATTVNSTLEFQVFQGNSGSSKIWGDQPTGDTNPAYQISNGTDAAYPFTVTLKRRPTNMQGLYSGTYQNVMVATVFYGPKAK